MKGLRAGPDDLTTLVDMILMHDEGSSSNGDCINKSCPILRLTLYWALQCISISSTGIQCLDLGIKLPSPAEIILRTRLIAIEAETPPTNDVSHAVRLYNDINSNITILRCTKPKPRDAAWGSVRDSGAAMPMPYHDKHRVHVVQRLKQPASTQPRIGQFMRESISRSSTELWVGTSE